jgi:hypothetical protein
MTLSTMGMNIQAPTVPGLSSARTLIGLHLGDEAIAQVLREEVGLDHQEATDAITTARLLQKAEAADV